MYSLSLTFYQVISNCINNFSCSGDLLNCFCDDCKNEKLFKNNYKIQTKNEKKNENKNENETDEHPPNKVEEEKITLNRCRNTMRKITKTADCRY